MSISRSFDPSVATHAGLKSLATYLFVLHNLHMAGIAQDRVAESDYAPHSMGFETIFRVGGKQKCCWNPYFDFSNL